MGDLNQTSFDEREASLLVTRVATTPQDRTEAYRLRYDVYIAEQRKQYPDADAQKRILTDVLDELAITIIALRGDRVVGTMRNNWFDAPEVSARYADIAYLCATSLFDPAELSVSSRLAVAATERSGDVRAALFNASYNYGLSHGTKLSFLFCRPALTRLFRLYGWREYSAPIMDSTVGMQHRMVLVMDDVEHLTNVNSPFAEIALQRNLKPQNRPWLKDALGLRE